MECHGISSKDPRCRNDPAAEYARMELEFKLRQTLLRSDELHRQTAKLGEQLQKLARELMELMKTADKAIGRDSTPKQRY